MQEVPPLDKYDRDVFRHLISTESYTPEGQSEKIQLVEKLIKYRIKRNRDSREAEIMRIAKISEEEAQAWVNLEMQDVLFQNFRLSDLRSNLIVSKGTIRNPSYTIMIPAHVDTFHMEDGVPKRHLQLRDDAVNPDRKRGHGVWDMQAAVLNSIALAADVLVPEGMLVHFVFTVDEEGDSLGARELIQRWPEWKDVDLVLSSEIGPLPVAPADDDQAMRYIMARRGRRKLQGKISIHKDFKGHGGVGSKPNAVRAYGEWQNYAHSRFYEAMMVDGASQPPLQKRHPLFPDGESFDPGGLVSDYPKGQAKPSLVEFDLFVQTVPPTSLREALDQQRKIFEELGRRGQWTRFGIHHSLVEHQQTSYPAYEMPLHPDGTPKQHDVVDIVRDVLREVSGIEPVAAGALSNADECLYADSMLQQLPDRSFEGTRKGVITIPPIGNNAHNDKEWVSWSDIARVRHAVKMLIEDPMGFGRLLGKNAKLA